MSEEEFDDDMECTVCVRHFDGAKKAEFCELCNQPYHWTQCGGWTFSNRRLCDNCREPEDAA